MVGNSSLVINLTKEVPKKDISKLSSIINLEQLPRIDIGDLPRTLTKTQAEREIDCSEARNMMARRFIAITDNMKVFIFAFELGFYRCIHKAKKFYPNIDSNFLTLINLNA